MAIEFQNNFPMTLSSLPSPPHNCFKWPSMSFHLHPWNPLNCMDPWVSLCFIDMSILFLSTPLTSMLISVHPNCIVMFFKTLLTTVPFLKLCLHPIRLQYASQTRTRVWAIHSPCQYSLYQCENWAETFSPESDYANKLGSGCPINVHSLYYSHGCFLFSFLPLFFEPLSVLVSPSLSLPLYFYLWLFTRLFLDVSIIHSMVPDSVCDGLYGPHLLGVLASLFHFFLFLSTSCHSSECITYFLFPLHS